jgi:uncharacterized protein (TIGR03118 family)
MKALLRFVIGTTMTFSSVGVTFGQHYTETNLVSNMSGAAPVVDANLVNPWGLSRTSGGAWWVADNLTGVSTLYNGDGIKNSLIVTIPPADPTNKSTPIGSPTGTISNSSPTDFLLTGGLAANFLFCTIDGTIAGWNPNVAIAQGATAPSTHAVTVVKTTDGSSYTGLTSAFVDGKPYLYAANFTKGRIDVYDNAFHLVHLSADPDDYHRRRNNEDNSFADDRLPRNFVPFNVQTIGNNIVVTYVLHQEGSPRETDGPGLGYVDIYSSKGDLLQRLEHGDWLNAPWGVALAPLDFGRFSHDLLIGQFAGASTSESSGLIAAYDLATGKFDGLLQNASGKPISINWYLGNQPRECQPRQL